MLYGILKNHPEICMSAVLEPHYFLHINPALTWEEYLRCFRPTACEHVFGEFSVNYMANPLTSTEILSRLPNVRIIANVRNPSELAYSYYWQLRRMNRLRNPSRRRENMTFEDTLTVCPEEILGPARLGTLLQNWMSTFDRKRILIVFLEDIINNITLVCQSLQVHLGLSAPFDITKDCTRPRHPGVSPRSQAFDKAYIATYFMLERLLWNPAKHFLGYRRAGWIKDRLHVRDVLSSVFYKKGYPPVSDQARHFLQNELRTEVEKLEEITGRDLRHWSHS
jgi:hypothetical protein